MINQPVNALCLPNNRKNIPSILRRLNVKENNRNPINIFPGLIHLSRPQTLSKLEFWNGFSCGRFSCLLDFLPIGYTLSENKTHHNILDGGLFPSLLGILIYERIQKSNRQRRYKYSIIGGGIEHHLSTVLHQFKGCQ